MMAECLNKPILQIRFVSLQENVFFFFIFNPLALELDF